jgi:hypothetical protein
MSTSSLTDVMLTRWQGMIELVKEDADKGFEDLEFMDERDALENLDLT